LLSVAAFDKVSFIVIVETMSALLKLCYGVSGLVLEFKLWLSKYLGF